jgi:hypothetical protein
MDMTGREPSDDVDRVFSRLASIDPPADFAARVAALTYRAQQVAVDPRRQLWLAFDLAALVVLAFLSIGLGMELHETGVIELVGIVASDAQMIGGVGDMVEAVLVSLPWVQVGLLAANVAVVAVLTRMVVAPSRTAA